MKVYVCLDIYPSRDTSLNELQEVLQDTISSANDAILEDAEVLDICFGNDEE